jgi:hypothetical protein
MKALGTPVVATELHLLREPWRTADRDDADQDLMFPACGSAEPFYSPEWHTIVTPIQSSPCPQHAPHLVLHYERTRWTLPLFEKGDL